MKRFRQESLSEKTYRYRGVILVVSVPLFLIAFVLIVMPRNPADPGSLDATDVFDRTSLTLGNTRHTTSRRLRYAVIFDAGSSGSRVHVYCFDDKLDLVPIGDEMELFIQKKPGLSSYADNPELAADSLKSLLDGAIDVVPLEKRAETPVRLGATAGLRALPGDSAENIQEAVRTFLTNSTFKFQRDWVSILDGAQEGAFEWVTINYLLGNIGKDYGRTVGIVDLGGGSVQMAYAISEENARNSPQPVEWEDIYVKHLNLAGKLYHLYVHSYLHYGLLAARAEILKLVKDSESCPCMAGGFSGEYKYGGESHKAIGSSVADFDECQKLILKALRKDHACEHMQCTFGGVWNGGGGDGQKNLFVASFFFDRASQAGIILDEDAVEAKLKPAEFEAFARKVCSLGIEDIGRSYPKIDKNDHAYFCMDIVYEYTLLVEGFGLNKDQEITLIKQVKYKDSYVEAAWPLGSAIEVLSSE